MKRDIEERKEHKKGMEENKQEWIGVQKSYLLWKHSKFMEDNGTFHLSDGTVIEWNENLYHNLAQIAQEAPYLYAYSMTNLPVSASSGKDLHFVAFTYCKMHYEIRIIDRKETSFLSVRAKRDNGHGYFHDFVVPTLDEYQFVKHFCEVTLDAFGQLPGQRLQFLTGNKRFTISSSFPDQHRHFEQLLAQEQERNGTIL